MLPSTSVPHSGSLRLPDLPLQLENPVQKRLSRRGAPRNVDIHRQDAINTPQNTIAVVVVASPIGTSSHADDPPGLWHLIITLSNSCRHLVCHGPGNNHDVCLSRRRSKDDTEPILVVSGHGGVHHFNAAAGETETQGPHGAVSSPGNDLIQRCPSTSKLLSLCFFILEGSGLQHMLDYTRGSLLGGEGHVRRRSRG